MIHRVKQTVIQKLEDIIRNDWKLTIMHSKTVTYETFLKCVWNVYERRLLIKGSKVENNMIGINFLLELWKLWIESGRRRRFEENWIESVLTVRILKCPSNLDVTISLHLKLIQSFFVLGKARSKVDVLVQEEINLVVDLSVIFA